MRRYQARDGQVTKGQLRNERLPDGVPASNDETPEIHEAGRASFTSSSAFAAPDMATPRFSVKPAQGAGLMSPQRRGHDAVQAVSDSAAQDARRAPPSGRKLFPAGRTILFAAILILLGMLGVSVMLSGSGGLPPCADQPDWNQYNCRVF